MLSFFDRPSLHCPVPDELHIFARSFVALYFNFNSSNNAADAPARAPSQLHGSLDLTLDLTLLLTFCFCNYLQYLPPPYLLSLLFAIATYLTQLHFSDDKAGVPTTDFANLNLLPSLQRLEYLKIVISAYLV